MATPVVFSSVSHVWKDFGLPELQQDLDNEATSIALRQDQSEISRKALVELSKEFKRSSSEETRKSVSALLKSFQIEVDSLSKRAKASETALLSVYKKLIDVPDPSPALEHAQSLQRKLAKQVDAELEVKQLRETLEEYNKEFVDVRNQEVTIKQLKDKIKTLEEKEDSALAEKSKSKEKELRQDYAEKEGRLEEERTRMKSQLSVAEAEVASLRNALAVAQTEVMELKARTDRLATAKGSEYDIVLEESERANERALVAEGRVASLLTRVEELEKAGSAKEVVDEDALDGSAVGSVANQQLQVELGAKQKEVDQLVEDVRRLQSALTKMKDVDERDESDIEGQLKASVEEVEDLKQQLALRSDYEEMKKELKILKSMECGDEMEEKEDDGGIKTQQSLEYLLLARNRKLMNENTQTKLALTNAKEQFTEINADNIQLRREVTDLKALVTRLEDDLLHVKSVDSVASLPVRSEAEGSSSPPLPVSSLPSPPDGEVIIDVDEGMDVNNGILKMSLEDAMTSSTDSLAFDQHKKNSGGNSDSLLAIVSSQRERFRQRNQELEGENISYKNRVQSLQDDMDGLRNDNLKLYEKIKFLQSNYSSSNVSSSPVGGQQLESRYALQYEQSLDPFQTFARKERNRKYGSMRPYEKATLALVRFILGSPLARTFAFFYSVFLHLLVFLVLYRFSLVVECHEESREDCAKQFADHMLHAHGGPQ